jgi:hypothetical protein
VADLFEVGQILREIYSNKKILKAYTLRTHLR